MAVCSPTCSLFESLLIQVAIYSISLINAVIKANLSKKFDVRVRPNMLVYSSLDSHECFSLDLKDIFYHTEFLSSKHLGLKINP